MSAALAAGGLRAPVLQAACSGTDQRLDVLIAEIRGLRADLKQLAEPAPAAPVAIEPKRAKR